MENKNNKNTFAFETITISKGNTKTGAIPYVALPAIVTCRKDAPCKKDCYACKYCRRRSNVKKAYEKNYRIYRETPDLYFMQLSYAMKMTKYFRMHVSGDIPDAAYFARLVDVVRENDHCIVLMFTKQFEIVNTYIANGGKIPENFKIVFSNWNDWECENPYNFPVTNIYNKNELPPENWKLCGGNCQECACRGVGCWQLQKGEILGFKKH